MCAASGNISFSRQSLTASGEPGIQKKALPLAIPAKARERIAAEPISS